MLCLRREEELRKLRKRLAKNTDGELRERDTAETKKMIEDAKKVVEAKTREENKTMRQMPSVSGHINGR